MKTTLAENIDKPVTIESWEAQQPESTTPQFRLNGTLEDHEEGHFYVRVKECYNGTSGISFCEFNVHEVERQLSGRVVIVLKR
jgi:hypothetical protein